MKLHGQWDERVSEAHRCELTLGSEHFRERKGTVRAYISKMERCGRLLVMVETALMSCFLFVSTLKVRVVCELSLW